MLKGLLVFGLTRRPIVLLCLLVFVGACTVAFTRLNIEAYPNPAPVILEITTQSGGLSAEEMERYYTIPMEVGLATTPGVDNIRSTSFYGLSFVRVTFKYGVDYYFAAHAGSDQPATECVSSKQRASSDSRLEPGRRGLSLSGGRPSTFRADEPAHRAGLDRVAALADRRGRRPGQFLGAERPRNSRSRST